MRKYMETPKRPFSVSAYPTSHGVELSISDTDASGNTVVLTWAAPNTLEDLERVLGSMVLKIWFPQEIQSRLLKESWTGSFYASLDIPQLGSPERSLGNDTGGVS